MTINASLLFPAAVATAGEELPSLDSVASVWPLFGLVIESPRLRLRLPRESDLPALARAARVISAPGGHQYQMSWMYEPSPDMERQLFQRHWRALADWRPESWHLPLAVYLDRRPIGVQALWATDFSRLRSVGTGSWISLTEQGHGYGTETRAAVLELAFDHLGAEEARTDYLEGNIASQRVSQKLHYAGNGQRLIFREGEGRITEHRMRLDRETWQRTRGHRRSVVAGVGPCLGLFGIR
jgi:RimJ/RimL family protein N-acetyltransferase